MIMNRMSQRYSSDTPGLLRCIPVAASSQRCSSGTPGLLHCTPVAASVVAYFHYRTSDVRFRFLLFPSSNSDALVQQSSTSLVLLNGALTRCYNQKNVFTLAIQNYLFVVITCTIYHIRYRANSDNTVCYSY